MTPHDQPPKRTDSRIEQMAKRARQSRREWKKRPLLKSAALAERTTRRAVRVAGRVSEKARRTAYSYAVAYGPRPGSGQSLAKWARQRRAWIKHVAGTVEVDTSQVSRVFKPGMSPRRRARYAAARTRRTVRAARQQVTTARGVAGSQLTRAAAEMAISESPGVRQFAGAVRGVADRVYPGRYKCPRCGATYRNTSEWTRHECIQAHGVGTHPVWVPDNPHNPTHTHLRNRRPKPQPTPQPRNHDRNTGRNTSSATTGGFMSSNTALSGGHPAQLIGRGGVALAPHAPTTDVELIWTLERLSAACQMVGNCGMAFAENLDLMGVDPRVVEPLKGFANHIAEGAAFPLGAHRMFWALYGHRIQPVAEAGRQVKVKSFFTDQR